MHILYFSRTGNAKRLAERIAAKLNTQAYPLCGSEWSGLKGLMRYAALRFGGNKSAVTIRLPASLEGTVILVAPIWDGRLSPPAQKALEQMDPANTLLVTVSKRSVLRDGMGCRRVLAVYEGMDQEKVIEEVIRMAVG